MPRSYDDFNACFSRAQANYMQFEVKAYVVMATLDDNIIPSRGKVTGSNVNLGSRQKRSTLNGYDEAIAQPGWACRRRQCDEYVYRP
jgi:hypothetical protein